MIIVGFPGVGKTSVCAGRNWYVDMESSDYRKYDGWQVGYVDAAARISRVGATVFTSSHKEVRDELARRQPEVTVCEVFPAPSAEMEKLWIKRLGDRLEKDPSAKNLAAYLHVRAHYMEAVNDMMSDEIREKIVLDSRNCDDLKAAIKALHDDLQ